MDEPLSVSQVELPPASPQRSRLLSLVLGVIPGWGHICWGRERQGLLFFMLCMPFFFLFTYAYFFYTGPDRTFWTRTAGLLFVLLWCAQWIELFWRTRPVRVRAERDLRDECLKSGMFAYVRGDLPHAAEKFAACLRLDRLDVEAQLRLGVVLSYFAPPHQARRALRRAAKLDVEGKWSWEIDRALERVRGRRESGTTEKPGDQRAPAPESGAPVGVTESAADVPVGPDRPPGAREEPKRSTS